MKCKSGAFIESESSVITVSFRLIKFSNEENFVGALQGGVLLLIIFSRERAETNERKTRESGGTVYEH